MQVGSIPDQTPVGKQVRCEFPSSTKPVLHVYVAVEPNVIPVTVTWPFSGLLSAGHSTAANMINVLV